MYIRLCIAACVDILQILQSIVPTTLLVKSAQWQKALFVSNLLVPFEPIIFLVEPQTLRLCSIVIEMTIRSLNINGFRDICMRGNDLLLETHPCISVQRNMEDKPSCSPNGTDRLQVLTNHCVSMSNDILTLFEHIIRSGTVMVSGH